MIPLQDTDLQWTPFLDDDVAIRARDTDDYALLVLNEDEVRAYCRTLRADMRVALEALRASIAIIAQSAAQLERLREQNRERREAGM